MINSCTDIEGVTGQGETIIYYLRINVDSDKDLKDKTR